MHSRIFRTNGPLFATLMTGFGVLAAPAWGQVLDEDMKFLPTTYAAGDQFGSSAAIDNGIIAVGAAGDDDNGQGSGSVYLFDATTGNRLEKLLPTSGAAWDQFGWSVAIDNGIAVVGAYGDNDFGLESGSAYLFDADPLSPGFGTELAKLLPPLGAAGDWFGWSVAIDDGIAVVGATRYDGNGFIDSGAAFFFDADPLSPGFGSYLVDVYPSSPNPTDDGFGWSVAIDNGIVAIGAWEDDTNGSRSGAAYLFDLNGNERAKLFPSNGGASHVFGSSVSIDNGIAAIGARGKSSAYLFNVDPLSPDFTVELVELLPTGSPLFNMFGNSISINNGIVAVGAVQDGVNGQNSGSAYLFDTDPLSPGYGSEFATVFPNNGTANDQFGWSIATENGIVVGGANGDDDLGSDSGSAFVFDTVGTQQFQLLPASSFDEFGWAIAIDNGIVAVGAWGDATNGIDAGAAYLFDEGTGSLLVKLLPSGGVADDLFGCSIAMANGFVVVGAWGDGTNGLNAGAAYVFDADPASADFGNQLAKLLPAGGMATDYFGASVAIDKNSIIGVDTIAVGAWGDDTNGNNAGAAYIFDVFGNQYAKLVPGASVPDDWFGNSISIDNGLVAVGAWGDDTNGSNAGAAYLFDVGGLELVKFFPAPGAPNYYFGVSIAIDDGIIAVGEYFNGTNGLFAGAAYLFDTGGLELAMLLPAAGAMFDSFGVSIAIDNGMVVVGANGADDNGAESGAAYMFYADQLSPNFGTQFAKVLPTDGQAGDDFGRSVSISFRSIAVGALWDDDNGPNSGSAYAYLPCPADIGGDWVLNFFDVSAFLIAFAAQDPIADFNGDGFFNFFDVSDFLTAFSNGCPP